MAQTTLLEISCCGSYGKSLLNSSSGTKRPMAFGLGMFHWGCVPYLFFTNDESRLTLTYFMAKSSLIPNAFICKKC